VPQITANAFASRPIAHCVTVDCYLVHFEIPSQIASHDRRNPGNRDSDARDRSCVPATGAPMHSALVRRRQPRKPLYSHDSRAASANASGGLQIANRQLRRFYQARAAEQGSRGALLFGASSNIANRTQSACAALIRPCKGAPREPDALQNGSGHPILKSWCTPSECAVRSAVTHESIRAFALAHI
jgi:hypothetical protein